MVTRKPPAARIALAAAALALALALVPVALAGKGGKGGGGGTTSGGSSSLTLAMVNDLNGNGTPNWGDTITFNVSTTATTSPELKLTCYQGGVAVYWTQTAYYAGYPFPWTQIMTLKSGMWTGGAADCTAVLYYSSGKKTVTLTTLGFHVDA